MITYWHDATKDKLSAAIVETVDAIKNDQEHLETDYRRWCSMYLDRNVEGFLPGEWRRLGTDIREAENALDVDTVPSWNVVRSCVDSVIAKLTMRKIDPWYQTFGAMESDAEQARLQEQFVRTILNNENSHKTLRQAAKLACINGTGPMKTWWSMDGTIHVDWLFTDRIIVDAQASLRGEPISMFHEEYYTKEELMGMFSGKEQQTIIKAAQEAELGGGSMVSRDMVRVIEAWKRSQSKDDPGKRVITVANAGDENGVLLEKPWAHNKFPITPIRWQEDLQGWHGLSGVSTVEACQTELNFTLEMIKGNLEHFGHPWMWIERSSAIKEADIETNERYKYIEGVGTPPQVITPNIVSPQVFEWANLLWTRAFELFGLSQLTAHSTKPSGMRTGAAFRAYHDIESERFSEMGLQLARAIVDLAWQISRCAQEMRAAGVVPKVISANKDGVLERIEWPKDIDENSFRVTVRPASSLPQEPSGRRDTVEHWLEVGLLDRNHALELMEEPDLEKYKQLVTAARDDLMSTFEHMLSPDGEYIAPFEWQDLALGLQLGTSYYLRAKINGVPKERLNRVERWLQEANDIVNPPAPPVDPQMPADPAAAQMLAQAQATSQGEPRQ